MHHSKRTCQDTPITRHPSPITLLLGLLLGLLVSCQYSSQLPYQNTKLDFETRVDDLVARMTLEEKVGQLTHDADAVEHLDIPE